MRYIPFPLLLTHNLCTSCWNLAYVSWVPVAPIVGLVVPVKPTENLECWGSLTDVMAGQEKLKIYNNYYTSHAVDYRSVSYSFIL